MDTTNSPSLRGLVSSSAVMQEVAKLVCDIAPSSIPVLISGESGTGKELVARGLHERSPRADKPFVAVNCGAFNLELLESTLFGHMAGSFTGALRDQPGCFEAAHGGTLFLDEIGDAPRSVQVRLLRVLQEGVVTRVGSNEARVVDVRVVAATHHNLRADVERGEFRQDLFYRLCGVTMTLPPLRDRREELRVLVPHFIQKRAGAGQRFELSEGAWELLQRHPLPGNVRELEMMIRGAMARLPQGGVIEADHLVDLTPTKVAKAAPLTGQDRWDELYAHAHEAHPGASFAYVWRQMAQAAVRHHEGNLSAAARQLGVNRATLHRLLNPEQRPET